MFWCKSSSSSFLFLNFLLVLMMKKEGVNGSVIQVRPSIFDSEHAIKDDDDDHFAIKHAGINDKATSESNNKKPAPRKKLEGISDEAANELLHRLIESRHKEIIPERPMFLKFDLLLMKVKNTVEKEGVFESVVALFMQWRDGRMTWDPADYRNITTLTFHPKRLWMPDIALINSADNQYSITKDYSFLVRLSHKGSVQYVPTATARTWCNLKLMTFPFDTQTCSFEFESWSMDSTIFRFNTSSEAQLDTSFHSPQWTLCHRKAIVYDFTYILGANIDTFSRVRFEFVIRRKSSFYVANLIFPCATLSLTQLLVFTIPTKKTLSDRIGFGTVNVLTLVVFQTIISRQLPRSSDAISALSDYIVVLILMAAAGIFQSVTIQGTLRRTKPPPNWAVNLLKFVPLLWNPPKKDDSAKKQQRDYGHCHECEGILESPLSVIANRRHHYHNILSSSLVKFCDVEEEEEEAERQQQRQSSRKSSSSSSVTKKSRRQWRDSCIRQWEELVTRFDCLVFLVNTAIAIVVPVVLFLPVIMFDNELCRSGIS